MRYRRNGIERRQLLKLAGIGGAAALLDVGLRQETHGAQEGPPGKEQASASVTYKPLYDLVYPLTHLDPTGKQKRIAFDADPAATLGAAKLNSAAWRAFVSMSPGAIDAQVSTERPNDSNWHSHFDNFIAKWEICESGYHDNEDFPDCRRVTDCGEAKISDQKLVYSGPAPKIDDIDPGKRIIRGEGFLPGAIVELWSEGADPDNLGAKPLRQITNDVSVTGTFRCSILTFKEALELGKSYDVYVVNRYAMSGPQSRFVSRVGPKNIKT